MSSTYKILLVGNAGVGKSSLLIRFADDKYSENYTTTIGVDFRAKTIDIGGKAIKLHVCDTAGQERFRTISPSYYKEAHGIIVVYDVTDQESLNSVRNWFKEVDQHAPINVRKMLVGNKCDLKDGNDVDCYSATDIARQLDVPFLETSAKKSINVEKAFKTLASKFVEH